MTILVSYPNNLEWRKIGDIPLGWMREHIDHTEQEGYLAFHETAGADTMQLMEMRLEPDTLLAPHSHDDDEIYYVAEGSLRWADKVLPKGGSLYIPAGAAYSFRTGAEPATLINFRSRTDHSFHPQPAG